MYELPESIAADEVIAAFDKVIIQRHRPEKIGNILLTEAAKQYMADNVGIIISKGPSADDSLSIGDVVIFGRHAGDWVTLPGSKEEIFLALDVDIMAVVHKKDK